MTLESITVVEVDTLVCADCGEEIVPPGSAVRMVKDDAAHAYVERRSRLVFHFHVNCAPQELAGVWLLVED
jgi:hypothetical protein